MRTMNYLAFLALCALLTCGGPATAESNTDPDSAKGGMQQDLGLTEDQAQKVRTIMQEQAEKRRALEEETRQRLSTVLNAEQMERMEKQSHHRREHGRGDKDRGGHMAEELDLTPEQKVAVEKIFAETRSEHDAMDKSNLDREQRRAQMEALHAKAREKLAAILNPDQLARFDEMHSRHMDHRDRMSGHADEGSGKDDVPASEPN